MRATARGIMGSVFFAFDLDGTLTLDESFPLLGRELDADGSEEMARLTSAALDGSMGLADSLCRRVKLLEKVPLPRIHEIMASLRLDPELEGFVREHAACCAVATSHLDIWLVPVLRRLECEVFCSRAVMRKGQVRVTGLLDKGAVALALRRKGRLVAVGDSAADAPLLRAADSAFVMKRRAHVPEALAGINARGVESGEELRPLLEELNRMFSA